MTRAVGLGREIASGAVWMVSMRLSITALGMVSTIVLARVLVPGDFGLLALASSLTAALEILKAFRLDVVLIQNQSATRTEYDSAWSVNLVFSGALALVVCLAAAPAADYFAEPRLRGVMWALSIVSAIGALENIAVVDFRKHLQFGREFVFNVSRKIVGVGVGLWWALELGTYWALVAGIVASTGAGLVASYVMHPYRPRWSLVAARNMLRVSKWLMLDNAIYFLRHRSVDFLIGKTAGTTALGLFSLAYETGTIANVNLAAPIERALFPGFAKVHSQLIALREGFLATSGLIALLVVPVAVGIAAIAPLFVPVVLGAKWLAAAPLVQVLGLASAVSLLSSGVGSVLLASGRPRLLALLSISYVVVLLIALAVLVPGHGATGASWSFAIAAFVALPVQLGAVIRLLESSVSAWLSRVWRPIAAASVMYFVVTAAIASMQPADEPLPHLLQLTGAIAAGVVSHFAVVVLLWWASGRPVGAETAALGYIGSLGRGRRSDAASDRNH